MKIFKRLKKESGAYTVLTAIFLTVIVGFLALSVDVGYHYYRGAQLQNAADAAATAIAGNLGTIDTQYEEIGYQYLAKNGFADRDKVNCVVYPVKGETLIETVDSDDYIQAGYYKIRVEAEDSTFFGSVLGIDELNLVKYSYAKADANYVAMPKALNYTIFAGSSDGTPANPAIQINGKTGGIVNSATALSQNLINGFNTWIVKPVQAFYIDFNTWWNPFTWKAGFNWNNANSWQAKLYTSNVTTSGDVHSNSNIESNIQAIHASRIQDTDFTNSVSAYDLAKYFDMTPIQDITPTFDDYGQVTFDAVKEITFNAPSGINILGKDGTLDTYYYVQNQQYIEQIQLTLRILDLLDLNTIESYDAFKSKYEEAAELYLRNKISTQSQKDTVINMVADGKLTYDASRHLFQLTGQSNIVYSVNAAMTNNALKNAYGTLANNFTDGVGMEKMLFGTVEGDDETYSKGIGIVGNDVLYQDGTNIPYYAMRNVDNQGDEYDNRQNLEENVNFVKYDAEGDQTVTATAHIIGTNINRDYQDFNSNSKDKLSQLFFFTNAYTFNKTIQDSTTAGANYAIASTFIENSEYIETPNLKPYFIRQINKSIRNATKIKEKINQSSAGQPTVRYAARERTDTLKSYQENLNYYDNKYREADESALNLTKSNTYLFKEFKDSKDARVQNLGEDLLTYTRTTHDGISYDVTMSRNTYKGYNLYDGGALKTPEKFYSEKLAEREASKKDGTEAVREYYDSTAKNEFNSVATKKTSIQNTNGFKYSVKENTVKNAINNETKPVITTSAGVVTPKVTVTAPSAPDVFLGYGTTGSGTVVNRTAAIRTAFNNAAVVNGVTNNTDTYTAPAMPTIPAKPTSGSGAWGGQISSAQSNGTYGISNGAAYEKGDTAWYRKNIFSSATAYDLVCENASATIKNNVQIDSGKGLYINNGGVLKIGGELKTKGNSDNKFVVNSGGKLYVYNRIYSNHSGTEITVNNGGELYAANIYFDAENHKLNVNSGGKVYVTGDLKCNDQKDEVNVYGFMQINGNLQTVQDGFGSSGTRNFHVNVKNGGVLIVKGNIDFTHTDYLTVESGGTLIVQNQCTVNSDGIITVNGKFIQLGGSNTIDASTVTVSGGQIYAVGSITSKNPITLTNAKLYTLSSVYTNNNNSGNDFLNMTGTSYVYVRGALTTNGSNKHLYIHDGNNSVVSILGEGFSDCFNGKCSQIHANNSTSGNKIYLGKSTTIYENNENILNGGICCFGNLTFNSNSQLTLTGTGLSYITGNFNATSASIFNVTNNQVLYVLGNINTTNITVDNAKVHANGRIDISALLKLTNGGLLEGVGGVAAASYDTAGGEFNSIKTIDFTGNISANAMSEGYVKTESVSATSMTLDNVRLKIEGNLTLTGALTLKNGSVLHVTGNLSCGAITLTGSKLYVDGNVSCSSITESASSRFLVRKGDSIATISPSGISCSGKINLAGSSVLYCEGDITTTAVDCAGSSKVYGYHKLNTTANYSSGSSGYFNITGNASDVFCGSASNITATVGIDCGGTLFYPNSNNQLNIERLNVLSSGKVVVDGSENSQNVKVNSYAYIGSAGTYVNFGKTKVTSCRFTSEGQMYFVGGVDITEADKTDMTGGNQQSSPDYFYMKRGSTNYISPYSGSSKLSTLTLVSNYEAWGDTYFDCGLTVKGFMENKNPLVGGEKGGKDLYGTEGPRVGHLGMSMYIPKGVTYVNGNVTTYADTSKDSALLIGNYDRSNSDAGLVVAGNINLASPVINYGKFLIRGAYNINNSTKQKVTEKNDKDKYKEGKSIVNGRNDGVNDAVFFVGYYNSNGNLLSNVSTADLYGYIQNYGSLYFNNSASIKGFNNEVGEIAGGDCAFINYIGAQAHFGGFVRLNSNQLYNKWKNGSRECIFSCDGKLTFGGCLYNLGTVIAKGDVTNNETNAETENTKTYRASNNYSIMNGMYKEFNDSEVFNNFKNYVYPEATIYCGGKMEVGATEQAGEAGSVFSAGTMYIVDDLNIFTNSSRLSIKSVGDVFNIFTNPNSHSFYRTATYLYDNSNTFIGGDYFAGAAMAVGKDTIFMCGGDLRSKRSIKLGEEMGMVYFTVGPGISRYAFTFGHEDGSDVKYATGKGSTDSKYNSAYFYVGGNALVNTIGSGLKSWVGITGTTNVPLNNSRDMDIYPNTNMYIGGSLYANSKVYMKDNVDLVVAGNKTFYDSDGNIRNTIYSSRFVNWKNFVPENLTNALNVENHLNGNKNLKFYVYQSFDMSPNSSMVVNGAMQVNETSKIRDMTKSYIYGGFTCGKYVEIGKSESGSDFSDIVNFDSTGEHITKDGNGNYKYLSNEEIAYISSHNEKDFLSKYEFDKSAYMFVNGDFSSGQDLGTGVLNFLDKIRSWLENTFLSTGYTKVYASSALKVNGNLSSSRYITLRHDAKVYCKGNMDAATSIEGGVYSEWYVGGHMEAATSTVTQVIDALGGLFNLTARGKIEMQDQTRVIVGGNMFSSASITLGVIPSGAYTRGRKTNYTVAAPEGSNSYYEGDSDYEEALILTYENGGYKDKSGEPVYLDGKTYKYSNLLGEDNKNIEYGAKSNVMVYNVDDGKYHKETYDGTVTDYSDGTITDDVSGQTRTPDTNNGLDSSDDPNNFGAEVFVQGSMIAQNGYIKEFSYTSAVVGDYVYAPDYITLRSNADLWVLPETFNNETYEFLPYPDKPEDRGGFFSRLWNNITYYLGKFAYETTENLKFQTGSVYTFGSLTVNKNASLMGTNDLLQLGTMTHADDSNTSALENFFSQIGTFMNPRKVVLREDSLVLFGSNITISSAPISLSLDVLKGNESVAGFDSKGTAVYPGYQYKCTNHAKDGPHKGYNYTMTVDRDEHQAIQAGSETLTCDICGQPVDKNKFKIVQVSHPAVMYAGNSVYISTTVDMLMTYIIADQGDVYLHNFYTKTAYNETNLKELPNAIGSFNGDINYTAWVGQLSSLFYAPTGNVDFDGIYTDIYGSVIGNTVEMNAYYQNFHRFNNWRTMDLHIAESGNVFLIPQRDYDEAEELGQVFDLTSGTQYKDSPYGVRIFF